MIALFILPYSGIIAYALWFLWINRDDAKHSYHSHC